MQAAKRTAARVERRLAATINAATAVEQKPTAPALSANGGGGGGTRVMIIGKSLVEQKLLLQLCCILCITRASSQLNHLHLASAYHITAMSIS